MQLAMFIATMRAVRIRCALCAREALRMRGYCSFVAHSTLGRCILDERSTRACCAVDDLRDDRSTLDLCSATARYIARCTMDARARLALRSFHDYFAVGWRAFGALVVGMVGGGSRGLCLWVVPR